MDDLPWSNIWTMLPLNALRAFALAVEKGGVRAAARELAISHSAVSRHVAELERWLGVTLLERGHGPRVFAITPQGQRLARVTMNALDDVRRAADALREQRSRYAVTVSTTPSFAGRWLLPRLPALERAHPRLEVSIVVDQRLDDPQSSASDFAIRTGAGDWPGVVAEPLMDDALYPVMSPTLWKNVGRPRALTDLRQLRLLHDRDPNASWQLWRDQQGPADLDVRKGTRFTSSDLVLRAAAQGLGVALARHRLVLEDLETGALVRPFASHAITLADAYWIVTPSGAAPREAVKILIAWLRREAKRQRRPDA
jgi:LysR family glycine cleavage system transcriptional activator